MGNGMFGVDGIDLPAILNQHLGPRVLDASLTVFQIGARDPGNLSAGQANSPISPAPRAKGWWSDYKAGDFNGDTILRGDRKAVLLGGSNPDVIAALKTGDKVTMEGVTLFIVQQLKRDPTAAAYTFQCRDRLGRDGV